jgi:hypothetical protein
MMRKLVRGITSLSALLLLTPAKRWLGVIVSAGLMAVALPAAATTAAQAVPQQTGQFWPGNLLTMNNADFENGIGDWKVNSNVSTLTTDTTAFLHNDALKIVASGTPPITSILQLAGTSGIQINLNGDGTSPTYRVGAYVRMPATSGHTTEFDLACYDSSGTWLGWFDGLPVNNNSDGAWQWVEDDIMVPSTCAHVQGSPRAKFTGMQSGGTIHMDEVWFAPERAALIIGAHGQNGLDNSGHPYTATDWVDTNWTDTTMTTYRIGPLQSDKEFYGGSSPALPGQWNSSSNNCYEIEQLIANSVKWPACIINLSPTDSSGNSVYKESQIQGFLTGMPQQQTVIFVYHGEPEGDSFSNCPGSAAGDAANFLCYFKEEANNIRTAAASVKPSLIENVFTADDSASSKYINGGIGSGCGWIVPSSDTDFYFEDHYERGWANGTPLSVQSGSSDGAGAQQWNNWLGCVDTHGKPIGLAEYGLCSGGADCNNGSTTCGDAGSTTDDRNTMAADNTYLTNEPSGTSPTLLWEYWYEKCWLFDNSNGGITEWQAIENQNGGAVGG